ncbi:hypothetical protein DH2020_046409 [Rehmannia glutinosa]|uniref:CCHC-type domain-containing protein n=1 Tax=Rehmannia glutinosa TaxID=99300 RepID=A0ABR0UC07_REHGL
MATAAFLDRRKIEEFPLTTEENEDITLDSKDVVVSRVECEKSLIGRVFGAKKINFSGFKYTIHNIWHTNEPFTVCEIGENLFQFIFKSREDKIRVRGGRTWSFDSQYIILRDWSEEVINNPEAFKTVELWVQLWNIPFHWLSVDTGRKIGLKFGKLKDIHIPEVGSSRGKHIKILVEVNLDKPLMRGTNIKLNEDAYWVEFKYENLQSFCFYCGHIGHTKRNCQMRKLDIENNNLNEGQFGEWLRASDLGISRSGNKPARTGNEYEMETNKEIKVDAGNCSRDQPLHSDYETGAFRQGISWNSTEKDGIDTKGDALLGVDNKENEMMVDPNPYSDIQSK